jgi:hypothetical protein
VRLVGLTLSSLEGQEEDEARPLATGRTQQLNLL